MQDASQPASEATFDLERPWLGRISPATALFGLVLVLALGLRLANLQAVGDGNIYYTAAVKSMLQSWHNFFFVAAEPGASVTVDKPPLGLWIQAAFAAVLGVSGFSVTLPSVLAGTASVAVLFHLVSRHLGSLAALTAALALAVTPISVAVDRNNTMDSILILFLLLAAWAFIDAAGTDCDSKRLRALLLGGLWVGLGFNIKMMQAFLPLPAFYALYFLTARTGWGNKLLHLSLTTLVLLAVTLSWAITVDLTPPDQRPYVGSSSDNTVTELIVGHNGLNRLFGRGGLQNAMTAAQPGGANNPPGRPPQPGQLPPGQRPLIGPAGQPNLGGIPGQGNPGANGPGQTGEIGSPGLLRLWTPPLAHEMSWLLPFGLCGLLILLLAAPFHLPMASPQHHSLLIWGGWLVTCLVFFSVASFFHRYYLAMFSPALAALFGAAFSTLWGWREQHPRRAALISLLAAGATIGYQLILARAYQTGQGWVLFALAFLFTATALLVMACFHRPAPWLDRLTLLLALAGLLFIPTVWSVLTTADSNPNVRLPTAYTPGIDSIGGSQPPGGSLNQRLVDYLQANSQDVEYLAAVESSNAGGSQLVLATGRPVLFMGGFGGSDPVIDAGGLADMVNSRRLRFVLLPANPRGSSGGNQTGTETAGWVRQNCSLVDDVPAVGPTGTLFRCGE